MEHFSEREEKIIRTIGRKTLTIDEIVEEIFTDHRTKPFDAKITVSNSIRRINEKCRHHNLTWFLNKDKTPGTKLTITKVKHEW